MSEPNIESISEIVDAINQDVAEFESLADEVSASVQKFEYFIIEHIPVLTECQVDADGHTLLLRRREKANGWALLLGKQGNLGARVLHTCSLEEKSIAVGLFRPLVEHLRKLHAVRLKKVRKAANTARAALADLGLEKEES